MDEPTLQSIHSGLVDGDPIASLQLFEHAFPALVSLLQRRWRSTTAEICEEAASDALFAYVTNPGVYIPTRGSLRHFLIMSARRDLQNLVDREQRRRPPSVISLDRVEESPEWRNVLLAEQLPDPAADPNRWFDQIDPALWDDVLTALPDERDRQVFALMVDGERDTAVFAKVLQLDDRPFAEQQKQVKRVKDRIQKRLQRRVMRDRHD